MSETRRLAMFPLSTVLFPRANLPLHVFEPRYRAMTADCLAGDRCFGVVLIARGSEVGGGDHRRDVGTVAHIEHASPLEDGRWVLMTRGVERIRVLEWLSDDPYPSAMVEDFPLPAGQGDRGAGDRGAGDRGAGDRGAGAGLARAEGAVRRVRALLSEMGEVAALPPQLDLGDDPVTRAWLLCALAPLTPLDGQRLLEQAEEAERLDALVELCEARSDDLSRMLAGG